MVAYLVAATLARSADGGAPVGLVLLAVDAGGGARAGGLLAACLTAPHLLGPWPARLLDRAADGRRVLAVAFVTYGVALGVAAATLGRAPLVLSAAAVAAAGTCGPLLTGGLSSTLGVVANDDARSEGWDAVTYGIAGTAAPAALAGLAVAMSPLLAVLSLAFAALAAAPVTLALPRSAPHAAPREALPVRRTLHLMATHGPLRRVTVATMVANVTGGALAVVAVLLGGALGAGPSAGAALMAAFGLGNLGGSLLVTAFPLRGEPEKLVARHVAVMAAAFAACAVAPSYPLALAAFAAAGASNAPFVTASLAARSRYSPLQARAQVFVALASVKVAVGSAGAALAGAAAGYGPRTLLAAGAALTATGAAATALDRRANRPDRPLPARAPRAEGWSPLRGSRPARQSRPPAGGGTRAARRTPAPRAPWG
jgi:hypothetical protein